MDPPQPQTSDMEEMQTLTAMATIDQQALTAMTTVDPVTLTAMTTIDPLAAMAAVDPQTLAPEANAIGYYQNIWNHPNNYFPSLQGAAFTYQNGGAQTVATMAAMPATQPAQPLPLTYCSEQQNGLQMQYAQPTGDMAATQIQYTNSILSQASGPRNQSQRSLMRNREAAREYRRRRKIYVQDLEVRVAQLETQNKALMEELKTWKEMCHHNGL
ncbi:cyclic AMP-dependent transcription factor ATF-1-like isoform X2 [Festucalex cinctus]